MNWTFFGSIVLAGWITLIPTIGHARSGDVAKTNTHRVKIQGYVSSLPLQNQFTVGKQQFTAGNQLVLLTESTVFENGPAIKIRYGGKVEVEGILKAGVLTATRVSIL